jgi:hypothetical protein
MKWYHLQKGNLFSESQHFILQPLDNELWVRSLIDHRLILDQRDALSEAVSSQIM